MVSGDLLIQTLLTTFTLGSLYLVGTLGLTIVWSTTGIFNWTYGSLLTLSGYLTIILYGWLPLGVSVGVTIIAFFFIGVAMYIGLLERPLKSRDWEVNIIAITLGLALVLDRLFLEVFGPFSRVVPFLTPDITFRFFNITINSQSITLAVFALSAIGLSWFFLMRTKTGLAVRAVAQNREVSKLAGIDLRYIYSITFGIGCALTCVSGILLGNLLTVYPGSGFGTFIKAWIIMVIGGFGRIKGILYASYLVAGIEMFTEAFLGVYYSLPLLYVVLLIFLIARPKGLGGI